MCRCGWCSGSLPARGLTWFATALRSVGDGRTLPCMSWLLNLLAAFVFAGAFAVGRHAGICCHYCVCPNLHVTAASCVPESQSRLPLLTCSALVPTVPTQHAVMSRRRRVAKSIPTAAPGQPVAAQHSRACSRPCPLPDPARACPRLWQVTCNFTLGERGG